MNLGVAAAAALSVISTIVIAAGLLMFDRQRGSRGRAARARLTRCGYRALALP